MRTAIVTGAASGIGASLAQDLARWGWRIFSFDVQTSESSLVSTDLAGFGGSVESVVVDVSDRVAVEAAVTAVLEATGGTLDALVANAGVRLVGPFEQTSIVEIRRMMAVNLSGAIYVTQAALPALRTAENGRLVVVSAMEGLAAQPGSAAYCSSKWAVEGWAESLAHELNPVGVSVVLVEPSPVRTAMLDRSRVFGDFDGPYSSLLQALESDDDKAWARALDPDSVSATMVPVVEGRRGLRHPVGLAARKRFLTRGKVPAALRHRIVRRLMHLDPPVSPPRSPEGVVMVTGCSSGFGLTTVVELARRGQRVAATMRDLADRGALDVALADAGVADRVEILPLDVTDPASIRDAFARADSWVRIAGDVGRIVGLVNNAGVLAVGPFEEMMPDEVDRMIDTNLLGTMAVTQAAVSRMRPHGGRIVFLSSSAAFGGLPGWSTYAATKWGIEGLAESLAYEVGPHGIGITLVEPGLHRTQLLAKVVLHGDPSGPYQDLLGGLASVESRVMEAAGDPAVVARVVAGAFDARHPWFRRPVGRFAWLRWIVRGFLPFGLQRRAIARVLG